MSDRLGSVITSRRGVSVGAPKNSLEDAFYLFLKDYPWQDKGFDDTNVPAGWEAEMAKDLVWFVHDRQRYLDSYRSEIL